MVEAVRSLDLFTAVVAKEILADAEIPGSGGGGGGM